MLTSLMPAVPILLSIGALFLPGGTPIRVGATGIALVALAVAAAARATDAPTLFHTINNALLWGGLELAGVAMTEGWRRGHRTRLAPMALASALAFVACLPLMRQGRFIVSLLAGTATAAAIVALAPKRRAVPATSTGRPEVLSVPVRRWAMPLLLSLLLVPALWLLLTVAGPGFSVETLRDAPLSSAAETLLAALILPATLVLAAIFPFGLIVRDARLAPVGALLLLAVVVPLLADGLEHWRALYAGWLVLGAFVAGWKAQWPGILACGGLFAIAAGAATAAWGGAALAVLASLLAIRPTMSPRLKRLILLGAATCGIIALRSTLGVEVVYSAAMVLATIIGIQRTPTGGSPDDPYT